MDPFSSGTFVSLAWVAVDKPHTNQANKHRDHVARSRLPQCLD